MAHKILFVIHKMDYGGAPKIMAFLANSLSQAGYDVYVLTYENMALMQELLPEVRHLGLPHSLPSVFAVRRIHQIIQVRKVINKTQPDVIISFLPYPNIISIIASMGTRVPVIISQRGDPSALSSWFTKFRDIVYNFADGCVFQTNGAKSYYNKRLQTKATVIPNPVTADHIPARWLGDREEIIVHVGRFELKSKRHDILIRAFSRISGRYPSIKLVLFGDGQDQVEIKRIITECSLEDRVVLAGITKNIYEAIRKAKLFVLSSDNEGIPNALIEAMCVGLPCVSTDCSPGGAAGIIRNMENGILVKVGCVEELATAMDFMLANPQAAEVMGQNALRIINDLDAEVIIGQWKEFIDLQISMKSSHRWT